MSMLFVYIYTLLKFQKKFVCRWVGCPLTMLFVGLVETNLLCKAPYSSSVQRKARVRKD